MRVYTNHNIIHHDPELEPGQALLFLGSPSRTVTPYDVYARYIAMDARICFMRARIPATIHTCHRRVAHVGYGSGRGGSVRFGDDMIPPDVQAVVAEQDMVVAREAWETYRFRRFLRKPFSIAGDLVYRDGAWKKGDVSGAIRVNALAIAIEIQRPLEDIRKIENFLVRKVKQAASRNEKHQDHVNA